MYCGATYPVTTFELYQNFTTALTTTLNMHSAAIARTALRRSPAALRQLHATASRGVVYQTPTEMYETPGKQKDPFKTVSSGYPSNDQGMALLLQESVKPEDLHKMASETGKGAQKALDEINKRNTDADAQEMERQ